MRSIALLLALLAAPAAADVKTSQGKTIECYCTDKTGQRIELGQTICMQVDGRMYMARCEMSLNNPMWREMQQGCLSSELPHTPVPLG
ncbi:MAG: hypothetical protein AAGF74_07915 [Pseudomonadota bacterium]